jgi:hypothetical protein
MPELPESVTSGSLPKVFVDNQPESSRCVKTIQADPTQAESAAHPAGTWASAGHVYTLESSSTASCGSCGSQTPIYPPLYSTTGNEASVPISEHGLILVDAETHPQNVILKFKDNSRRTYWCQVSPCSPSICYLIQLPARSGSWSTRFHKSIIKWTGKTRSA